MRWTTCKSVVVWAMALAACGTPEDMQTGDPKPVSTPVGVGTAGSAPMLPVVAGSPSGTAGTSAPFTPPATGTPMAGRPAGSMGPQTPMRPQGETPPQVPPPAMGMPMAAAGAPAMPMGMPMPAPPGAMDPKIPEVAGECPPFKNGTITFMGLGGITVVAGEKAAGPTAPMVFYWHGTGSTAGEYAGAAAAVHQGVVAEGGVLISFQGSTGGDLLSGTSVFGMGDFALTDQLAACAVKNHNVDPRRIFTTGCSAGGLFAAAMATLRSSYMAAAAPNSGGWVSPLRFQTMHTPALMTMHGAAGRDVVIVDFSTTSATADKAFKAAGGFVINCDHGGTHCGARALSGDVWKFFKAHPFGTKPSPWANGLPADFSNVCKIY